MSLPDRRAVEHYLVLQGLRDRGVFDPFGPHASVSNPAWFQSQGKPYGERRGLHDRLVGEVLGEQPPFSRQGDGPVAIVLAGPPGSGKSTARGLVFGQGLLEVTAGRRAEDFVTIDADWFKARLLDAAVEDGSFESFLLPEAVKDLRARGEVFSPLDFASLVHEESSFLVQRCRNEAIGQGRDVVLDQVCSSLSKTRGLVGELSSAGYSVRVLGIDASFEVSEASAFHRYLRDQGVDGRGRYVPSEVLSSVFDEDGGAKPTRVVRALVGEVPCRVEGVCLFVADRVGVPPRLVARGARVDDRMVLKEVPAVEQGQDGPRLTPKAAVLASVRALGSAGRMRPGAALQDRSSRPGVARSEQHPRGVER